MGTITTGIGLVSGINTGQLIDQLLAIEARPRLLLQSRIITLQREQAAFLDINTSLLALKTAASSFRVDKTFNSNSATSSAGDVLTGVAGTSATPGSFSFIVDRLVTTQQHLSRGFADSDISGLGATSFTFENGGGALKTETKLAVLNGSAGVARGKISLTDKAGGTVTLNLSKAVTVNDVLEAINSSSEIQVTATLSGDGITLTDTSGGSGAFSVSDAFGSTMAAGLGITSTLASGAGVGEVLTGTNVRTLSGITALTALGDGNSVMIGNRSQQGSETADFTITDRNGVSHAIFLGELFTSAPDPDDTEKTIDTTVQTRATTIQNVIDYIGAQTGGAVTAALSADQTRLELTDTTGGGSNLIVIDNTNSNRTTASDLGIATAGVASSTLTGKRLIAGINSTLTRNLAGGIGLIAGTLDVTDRLGAIASVSFTDAELEGSVTDLIDTINAKLSGLVAVTAQVNDSGNGIKLVDTSGGTTDLIASGTLADQLNLSGTASADELNGQSAQLQWITRATRLDTLNSGDGIGTGSFRITNSQGSATTVTIGTNQKTIDDVIKLINGASVGFTVDINSQGDGLVFTDTAGGTGLIEIEDSSGSVARSLNIAGKANDGDDFIDGSFEEIVTFDASDTLDDISRKINEAGVAVTASVINDGGGAIPFRLSLSARNSGTAGRTLIDTGGYDLGLLKLADGEDAIVFFGGTDPAKSVLLTTSRNTLDKVIQGVTIDLRSASTEPVELTVTRNLEAIEEDVGVFVEMFNDMMSKLDQFDSFDVETETKGTLFGDGTVAGLRTALRTTIQSQPKGVTAALDRLFLVGVALGSDGILEFDREKFRGAFEADPKGVADLFAARDLVAKEQLETLASGIQVRIIDEEDEFTALGVVEMIAELTKTYTDSVNGRLTRKNETIDTQIGLQESRIEQVNQRLEAKRARLERQFLAMELAIAQLQTQSAALTSLG